MVGVTAERPSVKLKDITAQGPVKPKDIRGMMVGDISSLTCEGCRSCDGCDSYISWYSPASIDGSKFTIDPQKERVTGINDLVNGVSLKKGDDQFGRFRASSPAGDYHEIYVPDTSKDYSNQ